MYSVIIADDHSSVRLGMDILVKEALGPATVTEFATTSDEVMDLLRQQRYDFLITDLFMPGTFGVSLVEHAAEHQDDLKIMVVTAGHEQQLVIRCLQGGAGAVLNKSISDKEFRLALTELQKNNRYLTESQKNALMHEFLNKRNKATLFKTLSPRESEVAVLLLKGHAVAVIASHLSISASTVSTLKARVFEKLQVHSILELNRVAYQNGLIADNAGLS